MPGSEPGERRGGSKARRPNKATVAREQDKAKAPLCRPGRPSSFTSELAQKIIDLIGDDHSLRKIGAMPGMPDRKTILRWRQENPQFATVIARAREDQQAECIFEDIAEIEKKVLAGELDPNAARVAIWSKQWRASKMHPLKYGDKQRIEHTGSQAITAILEEIAAERHAQRLAERALPPRAIDGELL